VFPVARNVHHPAIRNRHKHATATVATGAAGGSIFPGALVHSGNDSTQRHYTQLFCDRWLAKVQGARRVYGRTSGQRIPAARQRSQNSGMK